MAKRKSLNRRLSRYSKHSIGSAILDPDTDILGDEQPYWWKNLENNTMMRPSMTSNTLNQTSRNLDSHSLIETSKAEDGWWKVLETTDIAESAKVMMHSKKQDADNNIVITSESEEEPIITKRKLPLRSKVKKAQSNAFLNVLNESITSVVSEPVQKSTRESSMNKSVSSDKGTTHSKLLNKIPENSLNQTPSMDGILKLKPKIFRKRHKDQQRNVFDDVLKENEVLTPTKRRSMQLLAAVTESPIVKQGGSSQLALSFENEDDLSRLPIPEAQSTLLENCTSSAHGSNKDNNSDTETDVRKPKSKFIKRPNRSTKKNVFKDILAEEESDDDIEISVSRYEQAGGSFRGSQSTVSNAVNEIRIGDAKETKESRSTETITTITTITSSVQKAKVPVDTLNDVSIVSSNTSDKSRDHDNLLKPKSMFLKRLRKSPKKNVFQEILEEDNNVDALRRSRSDTLIDRTKKDLMIENQPVSVRETKRRGTVDRESNSSPEELHLNLLSSSEKDIAGRDENDDKKTSELDRSTHNSNVEVSELVSELNKKPERHSALHVSPEIPETFNRTTVSLPRNMNEVRKSEGSKTWNVQHQESASNVDVFVGSKHEEGNRTSTSEVIREISNASSLQKSPLRNQDERDILTEDKALSSRLHTRLSVYISDDSDQEYEHIGKTRSKDTRKSGKPSFRSTMEGSKQADLQSTPSRPSKKLSKSLRRSTVVAPKDTEVEQVPSTSERQSRNLRKSQKRLSFMNEAEAEDVQATPKTRQSKSLGKGREWSTLNVVKESQAEDDDTDTPERQSKVLSKLQNDISSATNQVEPGEVDNGTKRQSKSSSRLERQSFLHFSSESETEIHNSPQKQSRNSMLREQTVSPASGKFESTGIKGTTGNNMNESGSTKLTLPITGESNINKVEEEEEEEGTDARAKRLSDTRRSGKRITFNQSITKGRENENPLSASSKNANETEQVSPRSSNDTRRNVREDNIVASNETKGSVASKRLSTNRTKDSSRSQRNIEEFLNVNRAAPASQVLSNKEKAEKIKRELEKIKEWEMSGMKPSKKSRDIELPLQQKKPGNIAKTVKETQKQRPEKQIHNAFLVNGQVYKVPRLPRPKYWVTNRLYNYLWKRMEPNYKLETRFISEKFVRQLSNVTSLIDKCKSYKYYRAELYALMKEMARLGIIRTRNDFYHFCQEFFPYKLRVKMVPMLLPGNKRNIPYEANKLHEPLLDS